MFIDGVHVDSGQSGEDGGDESSPALLGNGGALTSGGAPRESPNSQLSSCVT